MKRILRRAARCYSLRPGIIFLLDALSVLQAVLQVGMALASRYVIDSALNEPAKLPLWACVLAGILLALVLTHATASWLSHSTSDKCTVKMQYRLLSAATRCRQEQLQHYHSGTLLTRGMEDVRTVSDGMIRILPSLFGQVTRLIGALAAVLLICPQIAPVLLIAGLAIALLTAALRGVARKLHKNVRQAEEVVTANMQEDLQQLVLIQSLQTEDRILQRFHKVLNKALKAKRKRRVWTVSVNTAISSLSLLGTGALLIWGAIQVAGDGISYGTLTAMVQLLALFRAPLLNISGLWSQLAAVDVADARLQDLLGMAVDAPAAEQTPLQVEQIVFENVTFRYPGDVQPVLTGFCAQLPLDHWACLTGSSGIGKSTLFKLILGLYEPQEGRVYLQTNLGQIDCSAATRHLFAYVPQDYALFSGTVLENLELVDPEATLQQRKEALSIAEADFVWQLTDGEQTQVLENNAGLSKGQLQRLAIARSVLMDRPILLLDECTSALDAPTEEKVLANLHRLGKQAIVVTHRPEVLEPLEQISYVDM